ncbi:MAG: hypothetical protein P8X55_05695 [Desulfosarcinaceae bacterium]
MRVSSQMMSDRVKNNLFRQAEQLFKIEERIVSGKRINRASDDPIGIGEVLNYRKTLSSLDQYQDNISKAKLHIDTTEQILDTVTQLLSDAKDIASDPNVEMRDTFAEQVATIREQVLQMANSQILTIPALMSGTRAINPFWSATALKSALKQMEAGCFREARTSLRFSAILRPP